MMCISTGFIYPTEEQLTEIQRFCWFYFHFIPRPLNPEIIGNKTSVAMANSDVKPKSISCAKKWSDEVENLYRFQQAGYRDEMEYKQVKQVSMIDCWPETGYVKKLQRRDNTFYYYNKQRECDDKEVHKVKIYAY